MRSEIKSQISNFQTANLYSQNVRSCISNRHVLNVQNLHETSQVLDGTHLKQNLLSMS
jgi:hypothetical protein